MSVLQNSRIIVQSDWEQVLGQAGATAWVTFKQAGQTNVHGEIKSHGQATNGNLFLEGADNFKVEHVDTVTSRNLTVSYLPNDACVSHYTKFKAPQITFTTVHRPKKSVLSLDVTPGGLAVSCDTEGSVKVWTTNNGEVRRSLEGHAGDVYTCRFFPSGIVLLTGGADTQLKIWSAETGQCAVTMTGHQAGVLDTAVVDRGRNVVSCSQDGTAKLWDCGQSTCLATFHPEEGVINACSVGQACEGINLGAPQDPPSEREVLTEGKLLLLASENNKLLGYGLQSRKKVFEMACSDAVNCCTFVSECLVCAGTQDGQLYLVDIRNTYEPLQIVKEQRSAILSLLPFQQGLFASTGDGSCILLEENYTTTLELSGSDCDPLYKVVTDGNNVYTACRDGYIRKYRL